MAQQGSPPEVRMAKSKCYYCGRSIRSRRIGDHIVPRCRGGSNDPTNLVPCCRTCNSRKGDKSVEELRLHLKQRSMRACLRLADMLDMGFSGSLTLAILSKELRAACVSISREDVEFFGERFGG